MNIGSGIDNASGGAHQPVMNWERGYKIVPNPSREAIHSVRNVSHNLRRVVRKDRGLAPIPAMEANHRISDFVDVEVMRDSELLSLVVDM